MRFRLSLKRILTLYGGMLEMGIMRLGALGMYHSIRPVFRAEFGSRLFGGCSGCVNVIRTGAEWGCTIHYSMRFIWNCHCNLNTN